ncbi:hypothetical protein ACX8XN_04230 [Calditrichota bacterium GD2]
MRLSHETLTRQWLYLYAMAFESGLGGYLAGFLYYYNKINVHPGAHFQAQYYDTFILFAGIATLIMLPLVFLFVALKKIEELPRWFQKTRITSYYFLLTLAVMYALYFLNKINFHLKFMELFLAFGMIFLFYQFQKYITEYGFPAWQNFFTTLNLGFGVAKFMFAAWVFIFHVYDLEWWICSLIVLELFSIFGRFKALNMIRPETRQTVRLILINYGFVFGARMVIGIFIPLIFCLYQAWSKENVIAISVFFLVIGEMLERFIFIFTAIPDYYEDGY